MVKTDLNNSDYLILSCLSRNIKIISKTKTCVRRGPGFSNFTVYSHHLVILSKHCLLSKSGVEPGVLPFYTLLGKTVLLLL